MNSEHKNSKHNLSVIKAIRIINLLAENNDKMSLAEISSKLSLLPSTAHHLITSLKMEHYVEQNLRTKKYGLGLRLFEIGLSNNYYQLLVDRVTPVLELISGETGESSNLAVMIEGQITYIAQKQSTQMMKTFVRLGQRSPVHCTGVGKVLISDLAEEEIRLIISQHGLKRYTNNTITTVDEFLNEVKNVKRDQYALDREEREDGVFCIAVPVYNSAGKIVAAISVSGPEVRMKTKDIDSTVDLIKKNTLLLSGTL